MFLAIGVKSWAAIGNTTREPMSKPAFLGDASLSSHPLTPPTVSIVVQTSLPDLMISGIRSPPTVPITLATLPAVYPNGAGSGKRVESIPLNPVTTGTFSRSIASNTAWIVLDRLSPKIALTLSRVASSVAPEIAWSWLLASSRATTSTGRPSTPPSAFNFLK